MPSGGLTCTVGGTRRRDGWGSIGVGLFDRLRERLAPAPSYPSRSAYPQQSAPPSGRGGRTPDDVAIERYRYLLRTAPPDKIEQAHAEAFAQLDAEQRQRVLRELGEAVPPQERARTAE